MNEENAAVEVDAIAVVGMAGRFPGAANTSEFWQNLRNGRESISFFSEEELIAAGVDPALVRDPSYVRASGVLDEADRFDAAFFRYTPREAEVMDPQHRVLLECAWQALEDAGCNVETYDAPIGVFAGSSINSYLLSTLSTPEVQSLGGLEFLTSVDKDYLASRISYKLDLRGPSITVQTACSTSLVAVCQACQSLADYQCDMALAGGVSVHVPQMSGSLYVEGGVTSPDGHTRAFDARGQGMLSGSGVGMVTLKRLGDAVADGDTIRAVIRGWAVNNDGAGKVGYTAPSVDGQANAIALAQMLAGIDPDTISYVEAHGTGTPLGDPIEIAALTQAFRASTERKDFCAVGSVKTNVGHLDAAAGVTGLIKTVLSLQHRELPPSLHFEQPNPKIDFASSPFYVNSELAAWKEGATPRRAGVSSFGIGGTNAHVVLEEAPEASPSIPAAGSELLLLSARTASALDQVASNLAEYLRERPDVSLADVAHTLQVGRKRMRHRGALVCADAHDAVAQLEAPGRPALLTQVQEPFDASIAFMFPGQGAQYVNMGRELYDTLPTFRREVDHCCERLEAELGFDLRTVLYPVSAGEEEEASARLLQTELTQPALFVIEYALARQWMDWGVNPQAMIGHSIGEYVAACLAEVLTLDDALVLVAARGRLMQEVAPGSMLAVPLPVAEVEPLLVPDLDVALLNQSGMCVIAGPTPAIEQLETLLAGRDVSTRRLQTSHAFHSAMLDPILDRFTEIVRSVKLGEPRIPYVSNVTGTWITSEQTTDPGYWARHMRQTIRFGAGLDELLADDHRVLLEVGPGTTLGTLAAQRPELESDRVISSMRHPRDDTKDGVLLYRALGRLWLAGTAVDWKQHRAGTDRQRIPLPTYPFERERYWLEEGAAPADGPGAQRRLGRRADPADWFYVPSWKRTPALAMLASDLVEMEPQRWLVFTDEIGTGQRLVERLTGLGHTVFQVRPGSTFEQLDAGAFSLAPGDPAHYVELVAALEAEGPLPDRIVHLWGMTSEDGRDSDAMIDTCFYSPVHVAQAIGPRGSAAIRLWIVGDGVHEVTGGEHPQPEKVMSFGPVGAIAREYPLMTCASLDLPPGASAESNVDQILAELASSSMEPVVAYRGGHRWVRCFEPIRLEDPEVPPSRLRDGGVYLVTGGLGGIGRTLALALAKTHAAKLVLVNRSELPEREQWESWLASHPEDDATSSRIAAVREMEAAGAEVLVAAADVADRGQMRKVIELATERFGAIHGVIHAAGIPGAGVIQLKTRADAEAVFAPKVQGVRVLDELLGATQLDFLLLCSSLTAVMGGAGQVDYTAANAFLDAFAQQKCDGVTISVNWDTWGEIGMAVDTEVPELFQEQRGIELAQGLRNVDGFEVLRRVLASRLPQVLVSTRDLQPRIEPEQHLPTDSETAARATHARPELTTEYVAPSGEVEEAIAAIWRELFGLEQIGSEDNFFELGGQSLLAIRVLSRVNAELDVDVATESFFDAPTIRELGRGVEQDRSGQEESELEIARLLEMVEGLSEEEVQRMLAESEEEDGA